MHVVRPLAYSGKQLFVCAVHFCLGHCRILPLCLHQVLVLTCVCQDVLHLRLGLLQLLYAAALIPIGLLADRVNRPRLLAGGLVMWSLLTMTGSKVRQHSQHTIVSMQCLVSNAFIYVCQARLVLLVSSVYAANC